MSKETIWTFRPDDETEAYVSHTATALDMTRTDFFIACIRLSKTILESDPSLVLKFKPSKEGCP